MLATSIEIKPQYYDEIVDLEKLFPAINKSQKEEFQDSLSPNKINIIKKQFMKKSERKRFSNNEKRMSSLKKKPLMMPDIMNSPNSKQKKKINYNLKKANASLQTTLIPIDRLQYYANNKK